MANKYNFNYLFLFILGMLFFFTSCKTTKSKMTKESLQNPPIEPYHFLYCDSAMYTKMMSDSNGSIIVVGGYRSDSKSKFRKDSIVVRYYNRNDTILNPAPMLMQRRYKVRPK